jgi:CheY-like chemotaxis protein
VIVSCTANEVNEREAIIEAGADAVWSKPPPSVTDGSFQRALAGLLPWLVD